MKLQTLYNGLSMAAAILRVHPSGRMGKGD
jgi:hypothetical protein